MFFRTLKRKKKPDMLAEFTRIAAAVEELKNTEVLTLDPEKKEFYYFHELWAMKDKEWKKNFCRNVLLYMIFKNPEAGIKAITCRDRNTGIELATYSEEEGLRLSSESLKS